MNKRTNVLYWTFKSLFGAVIVYKAIHYVRQDTTTLASVAQLGYPDYFYVLLGTGKLIGLAILIMPFVGTLKEWVYAGFTINMVAALWSHLASGSSERMTLITLAMSGVLALSYYWYHQRATEKKVHRKMMSI